MNFSMNKKKCRISQKPLPSFLLLLKIWRHFILVYSLLTDLSPFHMNLIRCHYASGWFTLIIFKIKSNSIPFSSPKVAINLVRHCRNLSSLSFLGYEDLSDIVLQFISGEHEVLWYKQSLCDKTKCHQESSGLKQLVKIVLPNRSFITEDGIQSLLQNLPLLQTLDFPG